MKKDKSSVYFEMFDIHEKKLWFPGFYLLYFMIVLVASCVTPEDNYYKDSNANAIDISDVKVTLPPGDGLELIETNCIPCHSLRYIEMQPKLSKKAWEKTVHKMIKNFGAPIQDSIMEGKIVEYLVGMK